MKNENTTMEYEKAIQYINTLILEGKLTVGSKMPTERALAETLGIGRNSTREALSILHGMGFVERIQGSGNYVSKNTGSSIKQILTIMLALGTITREDVYGFRRVMEKAVGMFLIDKKITLQQKEAFEELIDDMEKAKGENLAGLDKKFHDSLILATGNALFITIMEAITEVYREWIDRVLAAADDIQKQKLVEYHRGIFQAVLDKNMAGMLEFIDRHYDFIEEMQVEIKKDPHQPESFAN